MTKRVKRRRGTTAQHAAFTGALAEITVATDAGALRVHNGSVPGGSIINPPVNVEWFGGRGDDSSDNAAAINAAKAVAIAEKRPLYIPGGTWRHASQLNFLDVPSLLCDPEHTVLKPTSAVASPCVRISSTDLLSTGGPQSLLVRGLTLDGSLTSGKVGLKVGHSADSSVSARIVFEHVTSKYFEDAGGVALQVADCVAAQFNNCRFTRSETNVLLDATDGALPTMPRFNECYFNYATGKGLAIVHAYLPKFDHCGFEANGEEGSYLDPGAAETILRAVFEDCWWEDNYLGHASRTSNYGFKAVGTGATCQPILVRPYFSSTGSTEMAINLIACTSFLLDNPVLNNVAGLVSIDANCVGSITNWDNNAATMLSTVANSSPNVAGWRNSGQDQVLSGNTYADVTHGLGVTPSIVKIRVLPQDNMGNATHYWISNVGATTFRINVDVAPTTAGAVFNWEIVL